VRHSGTSRSYCPVTGHQPPDSLSALQRASNCLSQASCWCWAESNYTAQYTESYLSFSSKQLRGATFSILTSVCTHGESDSHQTDFVKLSIYEVLKKICPQIPILCKNRTEMNGCSRRIHTNFVNIWRWLVQRGTDRQTDRQCVCSPLD